MKTYISNFVFHKTSPPEDLLPIHQEQGLCCLQHLPFKQRPEMMSKETIKAEQAPYKVRSRRGRTLARYVDHPLYTTNL